jgi:hypothetical protein
MRHCARDTLRVLSFTLQQNTERKQDLLKEMERKVKQLAQGWSWEEWVLTLTVPIQSHLFQMFHGSSCCKSPFPRKSVERHIVIVAEKLRQFTRMVTFSKKMHVSRDFASRKQTKRACMQVVPGRQGESRQVSIVLCTHSWTGPLEAQCMLVNAAQTARCLLSSASL